MSKVIHKPNFKSSHLSKLSHSLLHRGQKSKDPYNKTYFNPTRLLLKTLGTSRIETRCSSTFSSYINNSKNLRIAGFSSAFILLILSALSVYPIVRSLNSAEAVTPTNSTTSLSITSTNSASVELLVKSDSGTFASSTTTQELNFNVKTDNYAGYELTLLGKDSTYNELKNSSTNTTLTSISGSKESSEFSNGNWGYTLDGTNYRAAPDNETGYQIEKTSTPNKDTAKTYTLGIGAKANYSTKAGTYTNTYVLTAVGNSTPYTIYYKDNTSDSSVSGLPTTQDEATSAININLSDKIPTRTGYTFSKWCDGTVTENGTKCSGTQYSASASFGIDRTAASNVTTLYAVWTVNSYTLNITNNNTTSNPSTSTTINFGGETTITVTPNAGYYLSEVSCPTGYTCSGYTTGSDATGAQTVTVKNNGDSTSAAGGTVEFTAASAVDGYLQDFTAAECSAMTTGETKKLGDTRDGQTYTIAKLADGNCWMDNLNLGAINLTTDLTSSNTNLSTTVTASTFNSWRKTSSDYAYEYGNFISLVGSDSVSETAHGTLYNYYAVSAGTIQGSLNYGSNAEYDICPKGWRLPMGGSASSTRNEFSVLYENYNSATDMRKAVAVSNGGAAFALAGYFGADAPTDQDGGGYYWSSTRYNNTSMYRLSLGTSNVSPSDYRDRRFGSSIRCVKKSAAEEIEYLQDMTPAVADTLATGTTLTLKDKRDENDYKVTKLADGNLWMTQNLRYVGDSGSASETMEMKAATSNISGDTKFTYTDLTAGNTNTAARIHNSNNVTNGVWYNYCAVSASTICTDSSSTDATYDICPKGWRLPTNSEQSGITSYATAFSPVTGGRYNSGDVYNTGYGFWWSATAYDTSSRYKLYYDGSNLATNDDARSLGLYVRCVKKSLLEEQGITTMQDLGSLDSATKSSLISSLPTGTQYSLTDSRDSQSYTIAKLADGKIWMTKNLNLPGGTKLDSNGSNVPSGYTQSNPYYTLPNSSTSGFSSDTTAYVYNSGRTTCSSGSSGSCYSYYSWLAATAGGKDSSGNAVTSNGYNAAYSICPKGWRLPTSTTSNASAQSNNNWKTGDFYAFAKAYGANLESNYYENAATFYNNVNGGNAAGKSPVYLLLAGYYDDSSFYDGGSVGSYWSSTSLSSTAAYYLYFYSGRVVSAGYNSRRGGFSVRCVLAE